MAGHYVVVTGASSETHLVYVASYLRHLLTDGQPITVAYPGRGQVDVTRPDLRALLPDEPGLQVEVINGEGWTAPADQELTYVSIGVPGLKPWAQLRRANRGRAMHVVVTDEGLGSYGTWRTRREAWLREGVREPWRSVRTTAVTAGARWLTTRRWPMYQQVGEQWRVVGPVAEEFRRHLPLRSDALVARRRVVLLSQPWIELGVVSEAVYLDHVERLAGEVDRAGSELLVRPHPSERPGRYRHVGELPSAGPAELDPTVAYAGGLIGGPSTAMLNLAAVHGVPAVRVGVPGRPDLDTNLSSQQTSLLDQFLGPVVPDDAVHERLQP